MHTFKAVLDIIGINPFVFVPDAILQQIFKDAGKSKGPVPVKGILNTTPYKQTLVKYGGEWRLYINTMMLKDSPKRIGEHVEVSITFDAAPRSVKPPVGFIKALNSTKKAKAVFDSLPASRKAEIIKYLANLKTEEAQERNIKKAIAFLLGKERFIGRDKP